VAYRDRLALPPQVPADFWLYPPMAEALAGRHMGRVLRAYRCHPWHGHAGVPQEVVGGWLHLAQAQISRVENGPAGKNLDWLALVARTLRIPAERLWFRVDSGEVAPEVSTVVPGTPNDRIGGVGVADEPPELHLTVSSGASLTIAFGVTGSGRPVRVVVSTADEPDETGWSSGDGARVYSMAAWRGRH
jgi:hypothetical protein